MVCMALRIKVAHDFNCPWCWIGLSQAKRLAAEFDVEFEWQGYELFPEDMEWPASSERPAGNPNKPATPSRFDLAMAAEGLEPLTSDRPKRMKTFRAHQALEFARDAGVHDAYLERLYRAFWVHGLNINETEVLALMAKGLISDEAGMRQAIESRKYQERLVPFDEPAFETGVFNVPTFFIAGERYAEQPYNVLRVAVQAAVGEDDIHEIAYDRAIEIPSLHPDRPTVFINMVATIDGKIVTGARNEPVADLGSPVDHATMRYLESLADGVMVGAGNLRATPKMWYAPQLFRYVVTESGNVDVTGRFFTDAPDRAFVVAPPDAKLPDGCQSLTLAGGDFGSLLRTLKQEHGIEKLLLEGGSELNASLLAQNLVDEIFLTIAPKVKLGKDVPTVAGGEALPRELVQNYRLISNKQVGDEIFLRYRKNTA